MFEVVTTKKLPYKADDLPKEITGEFDLPCLTSSFKNQGLNYYAPRKNATILSNVISIPSNSDVYRAHFQSNEFTVLSDAYAIRWKDKKACLSGNQYLFMVACINKVTDLPIYSYKNKLGGWNVVQDKHILLPQKDNEIDFEFIAEIVAELEAQRVAELEAQRVAELETYLQVTGLKDYRLTTEEQEVIAQYNHIKFEDFKVTEVFNIKNSGNILSRNIVENSGNIPYLCASADNNAVSSYISYDKRFMDEGNCVFIGGKTFVVTYQENDFFSNDSHNLILHLIDKTKRNKHNQLFLTTCINKSLKHKYSWGDSISSKKIKNDSVTLPVKNGKIDYAIMGTLISAIQKLVIKDVVTYADRKIVATKEVIDK